MSEPSSKSNDFAAFVSPGMPALHTGGKTFSFFEFWPTWLIYLPVILHSIWNSLRYHSLTVPLLANPCLPLSGMVGVPKSALLKQASGECQKAILDWFIFTKSNKPALEQLSILEAAILKHKLSFPLVCKPDIGCRGSGVQLIKNTDSLLTYLESFPVDAALMVQKLSQWEAEAGVFFVKMPNEAEGKIISLALKYTPYVIGDGQKTLAELIAADSRASLKQQLYLDRHKARLHEIIEKDKPYRLIFAASHCKGAIFRDAADLLTEPLQQNINALMNDIPDFYYGRLDIKFSDIESLQQGKNIEIVEINAASSESLHIWDRNTSFLSAIKALLWQYSMLFKIGHLNRAKGLQPPGISALLKGWKKERELSKRYPETD